MEALVTADCVVLVLPSGRSAHLEAGYAAGQAKPVVVVCEKGTKIEPELMYLLLDSFETNFDHFMERVRELAKESPA